MLVEAVDVGFYVKLRKPGERFDIDDARFSRKWMSRVEEQPQPAVAEATAAETFAAVVEKAPAIYEPETPAPVAQPIVKKRRGRPPKAVSE